MTVESNPYGVPSEDRIRQLLKDTLASTPWAQDMFATASGLQADFFTSAVHPDTSELEVNAAYIALQQRLTELMRVQVREGEGYLAALQDDPAIIVAVNHLGIGQVGYVDNSDQPFDFPGAEIEAFPMGLVPGYVVSQIHAGKPPVDIRREETGDIGAIHRKLDGIRLFNTGAKGGTQSLIDSIMGVNETGGRHVFQMFPEGRTSGWANNEGPYDLDQFRAGTFVVACETGFPVLPVAQYFDPNRGMDLLVLPPIRLGKQDLPHVGSIKDATRQAMQTRLSAVARK